METDKQSKGDEYLLNLFLTEEGIANPAIWYKRLRDESPIFISSSGSIFLSRYEDCRTVFRDNRLGKDNREGPGGSALPRDESDEVKAYRQEISKNRGDSSPSMLFLNPPDHTRLRGLVSRAFTPKRVESMRESITKLTEDCLDNLAEKGGGDAMEILGFLPVNVIGELVGVPRSDWDYFRPLVTAGVASLEAAPSLEELKASTAAFTEMGEYFTKLLNERKKKPRDDLMSALIAVEESGDRITEPEVISTIILLFAAGMETTQNLIGNGLGALFTNPDQMDLLWNDETLVESSIEEMLRFDSPVQLDGRTALEDAEIAGFTLPKGSNIVTLIGAANRDPERFENPDDFLIERNEGPPLSFASGIHYCLGANLARAEGQEMFAGLIRRFKKVDQAGELKQRGRLTLRGYETVPVSVTIR
ncbi:MAG: cytochrome P450 [Actinomycetota bacterium]